MVLTSRIKQITLSVDDVYTLK